MATEHDNLLLWLNAIIWFTTFYIYIRKRGKWTLGMFILGLYTLISFISIDLYNSEYAIHYFNSNLTLFPFLYLFGMILITTYPILQIKENDIKTLILPNIRIINIITFFVGILSIYKLVDIFSDIKMGMASIMLDSDNALDLYNESTSARLDRKVASGNYDYLSIFSNLSTALAPLIFYINLLLPRRNKILFCGVIISLLLMPLNGIAKASRILMVIGPFEVFLLFFFFRKFIRPKIRQYLITIGSVFVGILLFFIVLITQGRSSDNDIHFQIFGYERYFAEGPLVFNNYCMDANGTREGNITFPIIKFVLGEKMLSESDIRFKYSNMRIDNSRFSTYVGDFVLDFAPLQACILFLILSILLTRALKVRNSSISTAQIVLIYFTMRLVTGFFQYQYSSLSGNIVFFTLIIAYFFFLNQSKRDKNKLYIKSF